MKPSRLLTYLFLFSFVFFLGCSGSNLDERCGPNWSPSVELEQEINDLVAAATLYGQDQSSANCEAYKNAYQDYLDALKEWKDCYTYIGWETQFNQSIADTEESLDQLDCN